MTADPDDPFADRLAAWEEAPETPIDPPDPGLKAELRDRLERGRDCVRRLRRWGSARPPGDAPRRIGRFRIHRELGRGGFGVVFLAEQREPVVRQVALKVIKLGMDTRAVVARFESETTSRGCGHDLRVEGNRPGRRPAVWVR
ncbi:MAG: hypothetical protein ACRDKW_15715 [Actinomycetota bacterium]